MLLCHPWCSEACAFLQRFLSVQAGPTPQGLSALGAPYPKVLGQTLCVLLQCAETHKKWINGNPKPETSLINLINKVFFNACTLKVVFNLGKNIPNINIFPIIIYFPMSSKEGTDLWHLLSSLLNSFICSPSLTPSLTRQSVLQFTCCYTFQNPTLFWVRFKFSGFNSFWATLLKQRSFHTSPVCQTFSPFTTCQFIGLFQSNLIER